MGLSCSSYKIIPKLNKKKFVLGIINPQNDFFQNGLLEILNSNDFFGPIDKFRFWLVDNIHTFLSLDKHQLNNNSITSIQNNKVYDVVKIEAVMKNMDITDDEQISCPIIYDIIVKKETIKNIVNCSAFTNEIENNYKNTSLNNWLKHKNTTDIILIGLATDNCIFNTGLDGIKNGYKIHIILANVCGMTEYITLNFIQHLKNKGAIFYDDIDNFLFTNEDFL